MISMRRAFTLVELLVVIAVIALLAAILFPAFAGAREKARQAACISNQKQIAAAIEMYRQDYEGALPVVVRPETLSIPRPNVRFVEGAMDWIDRVYPYVKNGLGDPSAPFSTGIFHCPGDPGSAGPSYAMNGWFLLGGTRESIISRQSETVLLAEKRGAIPQEGFIWWVSPWPAWPLQAGTPIADRERAINAIDVGELSPADPADEGQEMETREAAGLQTLRHSGGSNWLFADGHARWARLAAIWGNATTTNQLQPSR